MRLKLTIGPKRNTRGGGSDSWPSVEQVRNGTVLAATGHHLEIDRHIMDKARNGGCRVGDPDERARSVEAIPRPGEAGVSSSNRKKTFHHPACVVA